MLFDVVVEVQTTDDLADGAVCAPGVFDRSGKIGDDADQLGSGRHHEDRQDAENGCEGSEHHDRRRNRASTADVVLDSTDSRSKDHCEETNDDDPGNELSRQQDCLDRNDRGEDDQCRCDNGPPRHGTPVGGRNGRWFLEQFTTRSEQTADVERCGFRAPGTATPPARPRNRLIGNRARRSSRSADLFSQFVEEGKRLLGSLRVGAGDAEDAVAAQSHPARVWSESAARRGRDLPSGARRTTGGELGRGPLD